MADAIVPVELVVQAASAELQPHVEQVEELLHQAVRKTVQWEQATLPMEAVAEVVAEDM